MSRISRPYGSWPSKIQARLIAAGVPRFSQPTIDGDSLYWLEGRPAEAGRQVLMRASLAGADGLAGPAEEVTQEPVNVRTRVHEYGGGDFLVTAGRVDYVDFSDQRIYVLRAGRRAPLSWPGASYADFASSPDGRWLLAVEERPCPEGEPENRLVAFALPPPGEAVELVRPRVVAAGHDFFSSPRFSRDGRRLAYTAWDHPDMPWDRTRLFVRAWDAAGPAGDARAVLSDAARESIVQPAFSPAGVLTFVSDRSGWWNLYQLHPSGVRAICPRPAEFAGPQWVFGLSSHAFESESRILCVYAEAGRERLARLDVDSGRLEDLALPFSHFSGLRVAGGRACFVAAAVDRQPAVVVMDLASRRWRAVASGSDADLGAGDLSRPEAIEFPSGQGRSAHAFFYPPQSASARGPVGQAPPLLVKSHGGPTAAASPALDLRIQYWTSRGFAVVDVDYGGSTGYGRAYRELLRRRWGVVDVEDCVQAALQLARERRADPERLAISGGSAGGYTTLCALTFHDVFRAGASHYGIGDLEALVRDTHKFESRYLDGLIGPYPERRDLYVERSPIHAAERLDCPVIFFQGLEDRVVPPSQAETMVAALAARGVRHAYVPFAGEQHGFRRAENIRTALDGELYFYSQIFGFEVDVRPRAVAIID